ncbi:MAG: aromatic amino acid hydroxylase, partial [Bacteroidota bacterium]
MLNPKIVSNPIIDRLPAKLKQYIKPQNYEHYSTLDQAVWRYVMRKNVNHLREVAHESYLEGLDKTGITIDRIPSMYGMNRILKDIGWAAVAVDGLIPSDAFMEFQAYNVLVIASDIRQLEHIEYTPTPDIIHESAGHAPILANEEYAEYLRRFGQIGSKAISSALDNEIYAAVRTLSILKENPSSTADAIRAAEENVETLQAQITTLSEMTQIRNLHWWTVEYGLIGSVDNYKQYGAGLLSSIGESKWCLSDKVKKIPYTIAAAQQNFDVTQPQPQLFVTPDFAHLNLVLEEFAERLSIRKGGSDGLKKLIESKSLGTIELSTGLQVSGVFTRMIPAAHSRYDVGYFQTTGETVFANRDKQLTGHGRADHAYGVGA